MHFVAALDTVPEMRGVLGLFEGVATGAADGYARMAGVPACTLLHLGPGLGNGLANLHNARKAATPMVNIVGDHATYHLEYDAPLASDIETAARNVSPDWVQRPERTADLGRVTAEAVAAALQPPGQVATLILPADVSWNDGGEAAAPLPRLARATGRAPKPSSRSSRCCARASPSPCCSGCRRCAAGRCSRRPASPPGPAPGCSARRSCRAPSGAPASRAIEKIAVLLGDGRAAAGRDPPPRARRRGVAGDVLRLSRQAERPRPRGLRGPRAGDGP